MKFYCVVSEFYDTGRVAAWIVDHIGDTLPKNSFEELHSKDVYRDYFTNKDEAFKFCDEAKEA